MLEKTCMLHSQSLAFGILATCHLLFLDHTKRSTIEREMDAISDSPSPPPCTELTAQEKSALAIPKRTEEDEQRLFRLFKGWTLSERDGQVRQWVYKFGYDIQETEKKERRWVCCLCIKQKNPRPKSYAVRGLQNAEIHLYENHGGIVDPTGKKQRIANAAEKAPRSIATFLQLNPHDPKEQFLINTLIKRFDKTVFQQKLVKWIVNANHSFSTAEDKDLQDLFVYLNPSVEVTQANITDTTVREIAEREFNNNKDKVKEALRKSPGQIHIQYDGWKSGNRHALYGITCVFRDSNNRPQKLVLGLPELTERHTGENIAAQIIEIIEEFEIGDKLGYFTLDNASNNKTSMEELGLEFQFDSEKRWVRCIGHVINIIVKHMLFGKNPDAFEKEVFEGVHTAAKEHEIWRKRGPVGKWHNFAVVSGRAFDCIPFTD